MVGSVNTNIGAQIALRNLNLTDADLSSVQKKISTGLRVSDANDNGAVFAIAQGLRSDVSAISTVNGQLGAAKGLISVSMSALTAISDLAKNMRSTLIQLADQNVTGNARTQLNAQFITIASSIGNFVLGANYNGQNLLNLNVGSGLSDTTNVIKDTQANQTTLGLNPANGAIGFGGGIGATVGAVDANGYVKSYTFTAPTDVANAQLFLTDPNYLPGLESGTTSNLNELAAQAKALDSQITFNNALSDATVQGLGSLVDADLAKESAHLQSLQIKQQLGTQSLGIANQTPQTLLGLFR